MGQTGQLQTINDVVTLRWESCCDGTGRLDYNSFEGVRIATGRLSHDINIMW